MKFRYNVFNFITSILFMLAFLCLMISYATYFMFVFAMVFFCAGFVMLSIRLVTNYAKHKNDREEQLEAIEMELASGVDGEQYVMKTEKNDRRMRAQNRRLAVEKLLPSILSITASLIFAYLIVSTIINFIK